MISRRKYLVASLLLALVGCENADAPQEPAWNKQRCSHCSMVVGDKRFAAQLVSSKGERLFFDDPGCLAAYELSHAASRRAWVLSEGTWLDAEGARFGAGARSPMDYGFEARHDGQLDWATVKKTAQELTAMGARQ
jgi:copper chaperone NosL